MKKLTTLAFLAVMTLGVTGADAHMGMRMEGVQNYMYYFGAPCPTPCAVAPAPCAVEPAPCMAPVSPCAPVCCPPIHGIFM
jgi:hypothetical protein